MKAEGACAENILFCARKDEAVPRAGKPDF
jgi:hypothetical protein